MPFRDISGHRHLLALLARAAARRSLPPSLIFAGPDGSGKRKAAVALAQVLNCPGPVPFRGTVSGVPDPLEPVPVLDGCGACSSCLRIARGIHPDLLTIEPGDTGAIKVDRIRDAIERAGFRPFEGRRRVVIVDEADSMVAEAQNAFLKTLEEPPPASIFVLLTPRPDLLLATVRSRCQTLRFGRLAPGEVASVLMRSHGYTPADAQTAAAISDGSVGLALRRESEEFRAARDAAFRLLETVAASADPRRRLDGARRLTGVAGTRDDLAQGLRAAASLLRDLAALGSRADDGTLANADLRPSLERLAGHFAGDRPLQGFAAVERALFALDRNGSPRIVADWVAFQL